MELCDYGCGQEAKYFFKNGKKCCSKNHGSCPNRKLSIYNRDECEGFKKIKCSYCDKMFLKSNLKVHKDRCIFNPVNKKYCLNCNKLLTTIHMKKFCSTRCAALYSTPGRKHSEETKNKIGNTVKETFKKRTTLRKSIIIKQECPICKKIVKYETYSPKFKPRQTCSEECLVKLLSKKSIESTCGGYRKNSSKYTKSKIRKRYPTFTKVEEIRYNPGKINKKEIQVRCKNHNCPNSKEKDGWFTPTKEQMYQRINAIEKEDGNDGCYFYCSKECKQLCPLFNLHPTRELNKSNINKKQWYTSGEYNTWREEVLKRADYKCEYCGEPATHCHHIKPQKLEPFFSLDPDWGVATCDKCHYKYGHPKDTECSTGNLASTHCNQNSTNNILFKN